MGSWPPLAPQEGGAGAYELGADVGVLARGAEVTGTRHWLVP